MANEDNNVNINLNIDSEGEKKLTVRDFGLDNLESELQRETYRRRFADALRSTIFTIITVAGIAVLIATLWLPVLQVYGTSMTPALHAGEIVLCTRGGMKKGNVIAFYCSNKILIKRVIGEQGDTIDIDKSGNVTVNGNSLSEPYVVEKMQGEISVDFPYTVPENKVFVLGDNRESTSDSRNKSVGCVAEEDMVGHVLFRVWPLSSFGRVK
ncbi:MAG: signal peptidase I [Eubacterium sp.]|nr:signal peptidase I [Eubacterium sp.]